MQDSSFAPPMPGATEDHSAATPYSQPQRGAAPDTRSRALGEILSQLNRDAAPEDSARALLPPLVAALGVDTGAVLRVVSGTEAELLAAFGHTHRRGFPYPPLDLRDDLLVPLTQRSDIVVLGDAGRRALQPALRAICHPRFGSAFVVSAFMGHTLGGFVVLSSRHPRTLSADDADFLSAAADAVGLALGSAALSQETHMSAVVLETAGAVARAISGSLDLAQTFRQIAHSAARADPVFSIQLSSPREIIPLSGMRTTLTSPVPPDQTSRSAGTSSSPPSSRLLNADPWPPSSDSRVSELKPKTTATATSTSSPPASSASARQPKRQP